MMRPASRLELCPDVPPGCPQDVRDLALTASIEGPELLAGQSPAEVGLILIHPDSKACPPTAAVRGHVACFVKPLAELLALAAETRLRVVVKPGWFSILLVGVKRVATVRLAHPEVARRERMS